MLDVEMLSETYMHIIDEASMLTAKEFAAMMKHAEQGDSIIMLGDPDQLLSVGSGNILNDLLALNVPSITLTESHRLKCAQSALKHNVRNFKMCHGAAELRYDESFQVLEVNDANLMIEQLIQEAVVRYKNGEFAQVIVPRNDTVRRINRGVQAKVNPLQYFEDGKPKDLPYQPNTKYETSFRSGDRVMMLKNNNTKNYSNGDIGILSIEDYDPEAPSYSVCFPDGRVAKWEKQPWGLSAMTHAYAITVHKCQGSEYDTVLAALTQSDNLLLNRNLVYTCISRARKLVRMYSTMEVLDAGLRNEPALRKSALVEKTLFTMERLKERAAHQQKAG